MKATHNNYDKADGRLTVYIPAMLILINFIVYL